MHARMIQATNKKGRPAGEPLGETAWVTETQRCLKLAHN